jgi:hypothetical protein
MQAAYDVARRSRSELHLAVAELAYRGRHRRVRRIIGDHLARAAAIAPSSALDDELRALRTVPVSARRGAPSPAGTCRRRHPVRLGDLAPRPDDHRCTALIWEMR